MEYGLRDQIEIHAGAARPSKDHKHLLMVVRVRRRARPGFRNAAPNRHLGRAAAGRRQPAHVVPHQLELGNICRPHYTHAALLTLLCPLRP